MSKTEYEMAQKCLKCNSENIYYKQKVRHIFNIDKNGELHDTGKNDFHGVLRQFCNDCGRVGSGIVKKAKPKKVKEEKVDTTKPKNGKKNGNGKKKEDLRKSPNVHQARLNKKREIRKNNRKSNDDIPNKVTTNYQKDLEKIWANR